jgi:hypothetical protein
MRIKYIGKEKMNYLVEDNDMDLTPNKIYDVIEETANDYRIVDDSGEDYIYPKSFFKVVN